jgi:AAA15 family ATPase/GTPase
LTRFLVKLFHSKQNKKNAQLIFTTHASNLLSNELFRRDQIFICSKGISQATKLSSFLDYDLRETADFERAYLK